MSEAHIVHWEDVEAVEMFPGVVRRTLGLTGDLMLIEIRGAAGAHVPLHRHPHHQVGYVINGEVELAVEGEVFHCKPGDSYGIPGDTEHGATFLKDTILVETFTPPREEYLSQG